MKYIGWCQSDFNVWGYSDSGFVIPSMPRTKARARKRAGLRVQGCTRTIGWTVGVGPPFASLSEEGVRVAQTVPAGPRIPVGIQLEKAEVGPTSGCDTASLSPATLI